MAAEPNPLARWLAPPARLVCLLGGWWLVLYSSVVTVEILGRKLFNVSIQGLDEVGGYTTAVFSALAFAWALIGKAHTRVDFLLAHLPRGLRAALNAAAYALLAGLGVFACRRGWDVLDETLLFDAHAVTPLGTPLWIPQSLWLAGMVLFAAFAVALALHAGWLAATDRARANALYGPITLDEEVEQEAGTVIARTAGKETLP